MMKLKLAAVAGSALFLAACAQPEPEPVPVKPLLDIPKSGLSPLPDLEDPGLAPSGVAGQDELPPAYRLLQEYASEHPEDPYVAVVGVWSTAKEEYLYKAIPLTFPDSTYQKAEGKLAYYRYRLSVQEDKSYRNLAALVPAGQHAIGMMNEWLRLRITGSPQASRVAGGIRSSVANDPGDCPDTVDMCGEMEEIVITATALPAEETDEDDWWNWPSSDDGEEEDQGGGGGDNTGCPMHCGGSGIGIGIGEDEEEEITVDDSILQNDLTDCVYGKLDNSQIFSDLTENFEGGNSTFDLKFELGETEDNIFGELYGSPPNDFVVRIDASWVTIRSGLGVAGTFLHEVMHAEMRRYLYDQQQNGSTIPGFPGSFTEDWNNYVEQKTGGVGAAEHEAMAEYFIGFLADGLEEFDNNQLDRVYYEAVAWDGLRGTEAWDSSADKEQIDQIRDDGAIENRSQQCSD